MVHRCKWVWVGGTRIIQIIIALMVMVGPPRLYPGVGYLQGFHTACRLLSWGPGSTCLFGFRCRRRSGAAADDDDVRGRPKTDLRTLNLLEIQIRLSNFSAATSSFAASCDERKLWRGRSLFHTNGTNQYLGHGTWNTSELICLFSRPSHSIGRQIVQNPLQVSINSFLTFPDLRR